MDTRVKALIGFAGLLVLILVLVEVGRTGGSGEPAADLTNLEAKPEIQVPDEEPPGELVQEDIVEGDGAEAQSGDTVAVEYVGVDYESGQEFDTSWDSPEPFTFALGAGEVIPGWDRGVEGMKVGGRRQLIIPPDLAYGAQGSPPDIGPNATLVFVIDLKSVE